MYQDAEWLIDSTVNWLCEHWPVTNSRTVFSTLIAKISTSMSMRPIITKNWSLRTWDMTSILTGQDLHLTILYHAKASKSHVHQLLPRNKSKHLSTKKRKKKLYLDSWWNTRMVGCGHTISLSLTSRFLMKYQLATVSVFRKPCMRKLKPNAKQRKMKKMTSIWVVLCGW